MAQTAGEAQYAAHASMSLRRRFGRLDLSLAAAVIFQVGAMNTYRSKLNVFDQPEHGREWVSCSWAARMKS
jgi:hypothetical protein